MQRSLTAVLARTGPFLLIIYLLVSNASVGRQGIELVVDDWQARTDFEIFYDAAKVIESPERSLLYDPENYGPSKSVGNFPYPPVVALLYSPLTALEEQAAKEAHVWLQLGATGIILAAAVTWSRRPVDLFLFLLVITSFAPFYITLSNGQPSAFLAVITTFALIALTRGAPNLAGGIAGSLIMKGHLLPLWLLMLLWRGQRQAFLIACLVAALVFAVPFLWLGFDALQDYLSMLLDRLRVEDRSAGHDPKIMTNWIGFWTNVLGSTPPLGLILLCSVISALVAIRIWIVGTLREAAFAAVAVTLIAGPHILPYDWMIILPAAFALACESRSWALVGLMALAHAALGLQTYLEDLIGPLTPRGNELSTHVVVPALFVMLLFLALRRRREAPVTVTPAPQPIGAFAR
jgi:hypothetical protein